MITEKGRQAKRIKGETMTKRKYNPRPETAELLSWMLEEIQSVPYEVTLRWAFYQAVQKKGLLKSDYGKVKQYAAEARKNFWNGWNPTTLVDDTRKIEKRGHGYDDFKDWLNAMKEKEPVYEIYSKQDTIVTLWFEAQAMSRQFEYYASPYRVSYAAFKGDPSINFKWVIAQYLADLYKRYRKPIVILYFGDYEANKNSGSRAKGLTIPQHAFHDIAGWFLGILERDEVIKREDWEEDLSKVIRMERIGLNEEHIDEWDLPENPERPGEYQWEALSDEQAGNLITESIQRNWSTEAVNKNTEVENEDTKRWLKMFDSIPKEEE